MVEPKLINKQWLQQRRNSMDCTVPGENRDAIQAEIEQAEAELAAAKTVMAAAAKDGWKKSQYNAAEFFRPHRDAGKGPVTNVSRARTGEVCDWETLLSAYWKSETA